MLIIGYPMLKTGCGYHELGGNCWEQINKHQLHFVKRLPRLGLRVTVYPCLKQPERHFRRRNWRRLICRGRKL
jgi:hypothetical protein